MFHGHSCFCKGRNPLKATLLSTCCSDTVLCGSRRAVRLQHCAPSDSAARHRGQRAAGNAVRSGLHATKAVNAVGLQTPLLKTGKGTAGAPNCLSTHRLRLSRCSIHLHCLLVGLVQRPLHAPSLQRQLLAGAASSEPITQDALPRDLIRQACSPAGTATAQPVVPPCW